MDIIYYHFFLVPFFLISSFVGVIELFTIVGFPKKDYNLGCVPLLVFIFLIAPSTLIYANCFSSHRNFFKASSLIFFYHFNSYSSVTNGFLNNYLASSKAKSYSFGITNFNLSSLSFYFLQYSRIFSID